MFLVLRRAKVRQWAPLLALLLGLIAAGIGALIGQPNSWFWFGGGVLVAIAIAAVVSIYRRRFTKVP